MCVCVCVLYCAVLCTVHCAKRTCTFWQNRNKNMILNYTLERRHKDITNEQNVLVPSSFRTNIAKHQLVLCVGSHCRPSTHRTYPFCNGKSMYIVQQQRIISILLRTSVDTLRLYEIKTDNTNAYTQQPQPSRNIFNMHQITPRKFQLFLKEEKKNLIHYSNRCIRVECMSTYTNTRASRIHTHTHTVYGLYDGRHEDVIKYVWHVANFYCECVHYATQCQYFK